MPHSEKHTQDMLAVEQDLLGSLLAHRETFGTYADLLRPEDFGEEIHRAIYRVMLERHDEGEVPSAMGIRARLGDVVGGLDLKGYLARLMVDASAATTIASNIRLVQDAANMRRFRLMLEEADEELSVGGIKDPTALANRMIGNLDGIIATRASNTTRAMSLGQAADQAMEDLVRGLAGEVTPTILTGIGRLDRMTGGIEGGQLWILAGRPAMGKTAQAITMGLNASKQDDTSVLKCSMEMVAKDLAQRVISSEALAMGYEIPYQWIANRCDEAGMQLTERQVELLFQAKQRIDMLPFQIDQRSGLTFSQIASAARRYFARQRELGRKKGLLIIDYLGLVQSSDRYRGNRNHELGQITSGLKTLAKELDIGILLLCQLNRGVEHREDKHPWLADLRDSGEIEQDADTVLFVYREEYYLKNVDQQGLSNEALMEHIQRLQAAEGVLEIGVAKQRRGPTGWIKVKCNIACNHVADSYDEEQQRRHVA